ncbi:MAG: DUF3987 domain-containing protein [Bacteroidaceae bacterium]|nr:DUF3987 domain-containing protein [Bacteroidaceae bacterium]MBR5612284.1 DUF3987 domain-containing protein [Bacteroidaceae bacterium]
MARFSIEMKRSATAEICTEEVFNQMIGNPVVVHNCEMYQQTHDDKFKRRLPGICFHAWFTDGKRHEESAVPSGLFIFDIDKMTKGLGIDPITFYKERIEPRIDELGILVAHVTPSADGLRLVACLRRGMDIAESQAWMGKQLDVAYDGCVKDLARLSFLVPESHFLYLDRKSLFSVTENLPATTFKEETTEEAEEIEELEAEEVSGEMEVYSDEEYKGIPIRRIVEMLVTRTGGEPVEGERNNRIFSTASYLRFICDFNAERLCSLIPHYGLSDKEVLKICQSASSRPRGNKMPDVLQHVIRDCMAEMGIMESQTPLVVCREQPKKLPPLVQQFVKTAPDAFKAPTVMALLPLMGTLATKVRFSYLDGCLHSPSFMTCIIGSQASGKSFIRRPEQILLEHIRQQDELERKKERAYQEQLRKSKNARQQPEEPKVCIRKIPVSISIAKLLKRLESAQGKHLISICEEIDTLTKTNRAGAWSEKTDLMRNAFDNTEYGQDYMSSNSYSTTLNVYYNLLFCGTPGSVNKFFLPHLTDGLVSRTIFTSLPDNFGGDMPVFKAFSDKDMAVIADGITRLENAEGTIQLPKLTKAIMQWLDEKRLLALETQSIAIDTFRKRCAVIGYRAGALAYLLNENVENRCVIDFACWIADYVLQQQVLGFGSAIEKEESGFQESKTGPVLQLFSMLPSQFTRHQLEELRASNGQSSNIRMIIHRWKKNGMIEEVAQNTFTKLMRGSMEDFYHPASA